jgi:membrane fusion protein (multidrug efflux system)
MARAAILEHAPTDRPEAVSRRLVDAFLHGINGGRPRVSQRGRHEGGMVDGRRARARPGDRRLWLALRGGGDPEGEPKKETVIITVSPVATRLVERTVSVVGTLTANQQADVASEVEGQVVSIDADLGDRVTKDQPLARVRSDVLEAKLREAEASYEKTFADEAAAGPLKDDGIISVQEWEQVRTALAVAKARRDQLRIEVERAVIRAPFEGSVAARLVDSGNYVRPGTTVFRLVQDDPLKFRGEVPERDVPAVQPDQPVRVTVDPYPGEAFNGAVSRVGSASNPTARSLAFEALVPNADHRLRPGFFGRAEIVVGRIRTPSPCRGARSRRSPA